MDWSLRVCSRRGHETYAPDEPELRRQLQATTAEGEAWRCLRCGDFVIGPAKAAGPATAAPAVPRGRMLRDLTIQRLLALERLLRGLVLAGIGVLVVKFRDSHSALQQSFDNELSVLRPLAAQLGWDLDDSDVLHGISRVFAFSTTTLGWLVIGIFGYAVLLFVESYGLWIGRRWGEYFSVVATSVFLPWEIYEVVEKATALKVILLMINIAAVLWLILTKRLFGIRGGGAAHRREHSAESLLTAQQSVSVIEPAG